MKKCPNCSQFFGDENMFCLNCGTTLLLASDTNQNLPAFSTADVPTQVIPQFQATPPNNPPVSSGNSSKWLFLIIGVLATALAGLAAFIFIPRDAKENNVASANVEKEKKPDEKKEIEKPLETEKSVNPVSTPRETPFVDKSLTPDGNWAGDWNSKSTYFTATASFTENNGKVSGQIVWNLKRTTNPKKINKVGATAVEYVQGTYDPQTKMLKLRGIRKDDPSNVVILDKYNLSLSDDNQTLMGKSINGQFILKR